MAGAPPAKTLSGRLVRNLSAHRTLALQAELARKPDVALAALVHRLALTVFYYHDRDSLLQIAVHPQDGLTRQAPGLADSRAAADFNALCATWRERLPANAEELFESLLTYKRADLLALLAVCVATTLDAVTCGEHDRRADPLARWPAGPLARAVRLDMADYWTASAENYFDHVSKSQILEGFKAFKPGEINRVAGYEKAALAAEAGRYAVTAKWLPAMLTVAD